MYLQCSVVKNVSIILFLIVSPVTVIFCKTVLLILLCIVLPCDNFSPNLLMSNALVILYTEIINNNLMLRRLESYYLQSKFCSDFKPYNIKYKSTLKMLHLL